MDPITQQIALASAGAAAADPVYVDDVFSTFLYEGNGSLQSISNGIDLDTNGGLVWVKHRNSAEHHALYDTDRGTNKELNSNANFGEKTKGPTVGASGVYYFGTSGFNVGSISEVNSNSQPYASWTFRKAPGFFDVVTWSGNGTAGRTISHNLGVAPGMIVVKKTNSSGNWTVYHRSLGATKYIIFNSFGTAGTSNTQWNDTEPTSTEFTVGASSLVNSTGNSYVAYLFAHDDQSFGTNHNESIIKCGSYVGNDASSGPEVNLGFEPQWVMIKNTSGGTYNGWMIFEDNRGVSNKGRDLPLSANRTDREGGTYTPINDYITFTSTGFRIEGTGYSATDAATPSPETYVYIAIRRSHKPPTAASEVFDVKDRGFSNHSGNLVNTSTIGPIDLAITKMYDGQSGYSNYPAMWVSRKTGHYSHRSNENTAAISHAFNFAGFDGDKMWAYQNAVNYPQLAEVSSYSYQRKYVDYFFKRAVGFFDIVVYKGTGSSTTVPHNLGVKPQLIIAKNMDSALYSWRVYSEVTDATDYLALNSTASTSDLNTIWNDTEPTSSVFSVGTNGGTNGFNESGNDIVAYLFASLDGISKVGSYTGTGNNINVDCGFSNGARFVMIKRTDSSGDWYVWDTDRGIVSGLDPFFHMNTEYNQDPSYDNIDPYNDGFTITSSAPAALNASGGTYLFLAIA